MNELKTTSIKQEKLLYAILGSNKIELENIIKNKSSFYYSFEKIKKDKRNNIVLVNGQPKKRTINATTGRLKQLQEIIDKKILKNIALPLNVTGGVKGSNNISNARFHLGKHYKFKTDLKQYFPSISHTRVYGMFISNGFSSRVSTLLTHITTHKYQLPQGTPTSTSIANLVFVPIDKKIIDFCSVNYLTYTRYVDDLVFSSQNDFQDKVLAIIKFILDDGFKISVRKTIYKAGNLEITGILTKQNKLDVTDSYKELVADPTIPLSTTQGRIKYISRVKAAVKKSISSKNVPLKKAPRNRHTFNISLLYRKKNRTFTIEFINYGYTYRFNLNINGTPIYFEPDEEQNLRAVQPANFPSVNFPSADLPFADFLFSTRKIEKKLLQEIAKSIKLILA